MTTVITTPVSQAEQLNQYNFTYLEREFKAVVERSAKKVSG